MADNFRWLRALIRGWSPGWKFSEEDFQSLKTAFSNSVRLSAVLDCYSAMAHNLTDRSTQEKLFAARFELITMQGAGHSMHCEQPEVFAQLVRESISTKSMIAGERG